MEIQETQNSQNNLEKEEQGWRTHTSQFQIYYKTTVIKAEWYRHKDRHTEKLNKIESPGINSHIFCQLIFKKGDRDTH